MTVNLRPRSERRSGITLIEVMDFISLEARQPVGDYPQLVLAGDRNLTSNGAAISAGIYAVNTNAIHGWTRELHRLKGNVAYADGSVHQSSAERLHQSLVDNPRTNRLAIP